MQLSDGRYVVLVDKIYDRGESNGRIQLYFSQDQVSLQDREQIVTLLPDFKLVTLQRRKQLASQMIAHVEIVTGWFPGASFTTVEVDAAVVSWD